MDKFSMDNADAPMPTMPTIDFEQTTTLPLDAKPFCVSIASGSETSEFMGTASRSHILCILEEMSEDHAEQLLSDFLASWASLTAESWDAGNGRVTFAIQTSNDGSTGPSLEEVEP